VEVNADRMTLRGRSPSYYLKQLAIQAALKVLASVEKTRISLDIEGSSTRNRYEPRP
jgi:hypothetical protein